MVFTSREKAFCVLEHARTNSNKTVQRAFVRKSSKKSPTAKQIWSWKKKFENFKAACAEQKDLDDQQQQKGRSSGFAKHSCEAPKVYKRTSMETLIPPTTVWRVVRKRLVVKPYKLQVVQAITAADKREQTILC